jgi:hypothetical protein
MTAEGHPDLIVTYAAERGQLRASRKSSCFSAGSVRRDVPPVLSGLATIVDELTANLPRLQQMLEIISVVIRIMFMLGSHSNINAYAHKSKCRMLTEHKLDKTSVGLEHDS